MDSKSIREHLYSKGFNQSTLAMALGCSPSLVSKVVNRKAVSLRVVDAISKVLQIPRKNIFPELGERQFMKGNKEEKVAELKRLLS